MSRWITPLRLLIGSTDKFGAIQKADLARYFQSLKDKVTKHSQISIYAPREMSEKNLLAATLKLCNPGDGNDVSGLTGNPRQIQLRYELEYSRQVDDVMAGGLSSQGIDSSPIMKMIQAVAVDSFPIGSDLPRRLVLISDMLQNEKWYSHYREEISLDYLLRKPEFQQVYVDLSSVNIEILYIGNQGSERLQTNRHGVFWEDYFQHMEGHLVSIVRIGG